MFEAAVRCRSFAVAAEELRLTPSAVSHQIRALETDLGRRLFHRSPRKVVPTDAGLAFYQDVRRAFDLLGRSVDRLLTTQAREVLTVHSTPSFATQWLMPRLAGFVADHPEIDVRFSASGDPADLVRDDVDIDIRYGRLPPRGESVLPIGTETVVPMASPGFLDKVGPVSRPEDVTGLPLIHSVNCLIRWDDWGRHQAVKLDLGRGPHFDRSFMSIAAAADGLGVTLESTLLAEREIDTGRLRVLLPETAMTLRGHRLVMLRSKEGLPKIRAFVDWLMEALARVGARPSVRRPDRTNA